MKKRLGILAGLLCVIVRGQAVDARQQLIAYLNGIAFQRLDERKQAIDRIQTRAEAEKRKKEVREKILGILGGLPRAAHGAAPPAVKDFGTLSSDGFRVEKIAYESQPGFWVTANVYVPATGAGPFPAILIIPGHEAPGKLAHYAWGGNFARMGIVAMAIDPLGQGERLQYYDVEKKASIIGGPTGEHGQANVPLLLMGEDIARYMMIDAMRGLDYLSSRKDVDATRFGAFGCSGGGTETAYFAALDDRVKAEASACYITSFEKLLAAPTGNQDAEQSLPRFIEEGLNFGDWIELAAPKPYAIVSTTEDMFPFEGARQTYDEAKRVYKLYGAEDNLYWFSGPGGHGNLVPIAPKILGFFARYLKGDSSEQTYAPLRIERREDLLCTPTGHMDGETVASLARKRAAEITTPHPSASALAQEIRKLTGAMVRPGSAAPQVTVKSTEQHDGYRVDTITLRSEGEVEVPGLVATPDGAGEHAAVLVLGTEAPAGLEAMVKSGRIVMVVKPQPWPVGTESVKSPYLGSFNLLSLRCFMVGKSLIGLRIDDAIRAVDWLSTRTKSIELRGSGNEGIVALHAAVLDRRIQKVAVDKTLKSYREIIDEPLHRNVSEIVVPSVLRSYDVADLRRVTSAGN